MHAHMRVKNIFYLDDILLMYFGQNEGCLMVCNKNLVEDEGKDIPMDKEIDSEANKGCFVIEINFGGQIHDH